MRGLLFTRAQIIVCVILLCFSLEIQGVKPARKGGRKTGSRRLTSVRNSLSTPEKNFVAMPGEEPKNSETENVVNSSMMATTETETETAFMEPKVIFGNFNDDSKGEIKSSTASSDDIEGKEQPSFGKNDGFGYVFGSNMEFEFNVGRDLGASPGRKRVSEDSDDNLLFNVEAWPQYVDWDFNKEEKEENKAQENANYMENVIMFGSVPITVFANDKAKLPFVVPGPEIVTPNIPDFSGESKEISPIQDFAVSDYDENNDIMDEGFLDEMVENMIKDALDSLITENMVAIETNEIVETDALNQESKDEDKEKSDQKVVSKVDSNIITSDSSLLTEPQSTHETNQEINQNIIAESENMTPAPLQDKIQEASAGISYARFSTIFVTLFIGLYIV